MLPGLPDRRVAARLLEHASALPLAADAAAVEHLERAAPDGRRRTALVRLRGGGCEGVGEDVTFQPEDLLREPPHPELWRGIATLGQLWERLDGAELFERAPRYDVVRSYRRWALEAAALDLALRQARLPLAALAGCRSQPVRLVVSPARGHLRRFPGALLKIDAADLEPGLPVEIVDFKGDGNAELVGRVRALYPEALLEDPPLPVERARVSFDVGIRSAADVLALPSARAAVNVNPARLGGVRSLLEVYRACADRGIAVYGGGQHELGAGRGQIQLLASLFHPDAPNDVAPAEYNDAEPPARLLSSPLAVSERPGFG